MLEKNIPSVTPRGTRRTAPRQRGAGGTGEPAQGREGLMQVETVPHLQSCDREKSQGCLERKPRVVGQAPDTRVSQGGRDVQSTFPWQSSHLWGWDGGRLFLR